MRIRRKSVAIGVFGLTLTVFFSAALASDGVVEISQAKVLANGGHFPFTISSPGSYRLTSNLDITADSTNAAPVQNRIAIQLNVGDVTIDLNGFAIIGSLTCPYGGGGGCSVLGGTGAGINAGVSLSNITIRNGSIYGMGSYGIYAVLTNASARVENVMARDNGYAGIAIHGAAEDCTANRNGLYGFLVTGLVRDSVANGNAYSGMHVNEGIIENSTATDNGNRAADCYLCTVRGNTLQTSNGPAFVANGPQVLLVNNVLSRGTGSPAVDFVTTGYPAAYAGNVIKSTAPTVNLGVEIGTNLCNGTTTCP